MAAVEGWDRKEIEEHQQEIGGAHHPEKDCGIISDLVIVDEDAVAAEDAK